MLVPIVTRYPGSIATSISATPQHSPLLGWSNRLFLAAQVSMAALLTFSGGAHGKKRRLASGATSRAVNFLRSS